MVKEMYFDNSKKSEFKAKKKVVKEKFLDEGKKNRFSKKW